MKRLLTRLGVAVFLVWCLGLPLGALEAQAPLTDTRFQEINAKRTAHSRVFARLLTDPQEVPQGAAAPESGDGAAIIEQYTEIGGGMHWNAAQAGLDQKPVWMQTRLGWEAMPNGGAMVVEAPRMAWLSAKLDGIPMLVIKPERPDEPVLAFAFHGLAYVERSTDKLAWIGQVQASRLEIEDTIGYYPNAITNLSATWVVEHKYSGIGAGLVLHEMPPPPQHYGFNSDHGVDLVVVSEVVGVEESSKLRFKDHPNKPGQLIGIGQLRGTGFGHRPIDFQSDIHHGTHRLDRGYAFLLADGDGLSIGMEDSDEHTRLHPSLIEAEDSEIEVKTALVQTNDHRILLYECLPYHRLQSPSLQRALPPVGMSQGLANRRMTIENPVLPVSHMANRPLENTSALLTQFRETRNAKTEAPVRLAMITGRDLQSDSDPSWAKGFYIDFETVSASTTNTLHFLAGQTYHISSAISISQELIIEEGAVVKLSGAGRLTLLDGANVITPANDYAPASFVSKNCNEIGAIISGSTGTPARGDYQRGLVLYDEDGGALRNLRLAHSWQALELVAGAWEFDNIVLRDNYCAMAIMENASAVLRNSLVHTGKYWAFRLYVDNSTPGANAPDSDLFQLRTEHVTVTGDNNYVVRFDWTGSGTGYSTFSAVNSIFGWPNVSFCSRNSTALSWRDEFKHCAFRSATDPSVGMRENCLTLTQTTDNYFTARATGNYYLTPTVSGTPNPLIDAGMSTESLKTLLADKTALPPAELATAWNTAGRLPKVPADGTDNDPLDLGYHYPKVDGLVGTSGLSIEADLELTPGQVVAADNMIIVTAGAKILAQGSAAEPVVMVPCWQISDDLVGYRPAASADKWTGLWVKNTAAIGNVLQNTVLNGFWRGAVLDPRRMTRMRDNHISAFEVGVYAWSADEGVSGYSGELLIENCLFQGMGDRAIALYQILSRSTLRCCTFVNHGSTAVYPGGTGKATVINSLFSDGYMPWVYDLDRLALDHCGFFNTTTPLMSTQSRNCTVSPFASGPQGPFYLNTTPSGGDLLRGNPATTAKGGTGTAAANGVFHRTVDPAGTAGEGYAEVSIGYHYPPASMPDSDADGLADVDEDANGNGTTDLGETDFLNADSDSDFFTDGEERFHGTDPLSAGDTPAVEGQEQSSKDPNPFRKATGFRVYHPGGDRTNWDDWKHSDYIEIEAAPEVKEVFLLLRARFPRFYVIGGDQGFAVSPASLTRPSLFIVESLDRQFDGPHLVQNLNGARNIAVPHAGPGDDPGELVTHTILFKIPFEDRITFTITGDPQYSVGSYVEILKAWPSMECDDEFDPTQVDFVLSPPDFSWIEGQDIQDCCNHTLKSGMCFSCTRSVGGANVRLDRGMEVSFNAGGSWSSSAPAKIVFKLDSLEGTFPELTPEVCYTVRNPGDRVLRRSDDLALLQFLSSETFVDVSSSGDGMALYFYPVTSDIYGDPPPLSLDPDIDPWLVRWTVGMPAGGEIVLTRSMSKNPEGSTNGSSDISTKEYRFNLDPINQDWALTTDPGTTQEHRTSQITSHNGLLRVVTEFKEYPNDPSLPGVTVIERTYRLFPWGEELIKEVVDPAGRAQTTTWDFHVTGPGYGALKKITYPDGMWAAYGYLPEDGGRLSTWTTPWTDGQLVQVIDYAYVSHVGTDVLADDKRPRTTVTRVGGVAVNATLVEYGPYTKTEKRSPTPQNPTWNDPANEVTVWTYHTPPLPIGGKEQVKSFLQPDGQFTFIHLQEGAINSLVSSSHYPGLTNETGIRRMTFQGGAPTDSSKEIFLYKDKSTVEVTLESSSGQELVREIFVFTGSNRNFVTGTFNPATGNALFSRMGWTRTEYDGLGRWIAKTYDDGSAESQTWVADGSCCNGRNHVDRFGVETEYRYDSHGRLISETRLAVPQITINGVTHPAIPALHRSFVYDASGRKIEQVEDDGTNTLTSTWSYNGAGELISKTNPAGGTTQYLYGIDPWGRRFEEQIQPGGATIRKTYYLDGQEASETGTGTVDRYVEHGVDPANGRLFTRETHGYPDSADVKVIYLDAMGRPVRIEKPSFGGGAPTIEENLYDPSGKLVRVSKSGFPDQYFTYEPMGNSLLEGADLDGVAGLQPNSGLDQVTQRVWGFRSLSQTIDGQTDTGWFLYSQTSAFLTPGSATPLDLGSSYARVSLAGTFLPSSRKLKARTISAADGVTDTTILNHPGQVWTLERTDHVDTTLSERSLLRLGLQHRLIAQTGAETRIEYDGHGRERYRIQVTSPVQAITETVYMADSPLVSVKREGLDAARTPSSALSQVSYSYDAAGRVAKTLYLDGSSTRTEYDAMGYILRVWGDAAQPASYLYDDWGRRISMKTYRGGANWNAAAWTQIPTGSADETTWVYDEATGLLLQKHDAEQRGYTLDYFPNGQLKKRTWARGVSVYFDYYGPYYGDATSPSNTGLLKAMRFSDGTTQETYQYLARTKMPSQITDQAGTRTFTYDASHAMRLTKETLLAGGLFSKQLELIPKYTTDNRNGGLEIRQNGIAYPPLFNQDYSYALGTANTARIQKMQLNGNAATSFTFTYLNGGMGPIERVEFGLFSRNMTYSNSTERRMFLTQVDNRINEISRSKFEYHYNSRYQRTNVIETGAAVPTPGAHNRFDYNTYGELTESDRFTTTNPSLEPAPANARIAGEYRAYAYDNTGNRDWTAKQYAPNTEVTDYTANALNQYTIPGDATAIQYDADGNLIKERDAARAYQYDALNRLRAIGPVSPQAGDRQLTFHYDYLGRRIARQEQVYVNSTTTQLVNSRLFVYDGRRNVLELNGSNADALIAKYWWGPNMNGQVDVEAMPGTLYAAQRSDVGTSDIILYAYDGNGNVTDLVRMSGQTPIPAGQYRYDPFGNPLPPSTTYGAVADKNRFRFATKYLESATLHDDSNNALDVSVTLYDFGRRFYDPVAGRWLSRDPLEEAAGSNLYKYSSNDPIGRTDPTGLATHLAFVLGPDVVGRIKDFYVLSGWPLLDPEVIKTIENDVKRYFFAEKYVR
ncbi:MAG: RHS repeat-associated core domain-containing protein, partial [Verrucomicrobiota bacterium]|nr:RHS repeat-associated core domain-containing protein [Verrucomicrobiota bacterium]